MQVEGRTFLVTGGASGLGRATAIALLERGAEVVVADLAADPPPGARFVKADVTDQAQVADAVDAATGRTAAFAGAVNCAGIAVARKVIGKHGLHDQDEFLRVLSVNLGGTFNVIRLTAAALREIEPDESGERGVIVNTASVAAFDGQIGQAAYSASKGGVAAMTLPIARELAAYGIRVVTVAPGVFLTPMMGVLSDQAVRSLGAQVPFPPRLGDPAEYAALVCHVLSNQMVNGEVIRLDGALRMAAR
jgi:NAD(P)-dependent dehydrogenase (short-subunit alcohol dehydrogenase family)